VGDGRMSLQVRDSSTASSASTEVTTVAWLLGAVLLLTFGYFVPAATWSPMSRFGVTRSLVEERGVTLGTWAAATGDRSRRNDAWYSDKAPLPALWGAMPYAAVRGVHFALGRDAPAFEARAEGNVPAVRVTLNRSAQQLLYAASLGTSGLAGALVGLWLFLWLRRRFTTSASLVGAVAIVLGTPLFPYATSLFGHTPAAAGLLGALFFGEPQAPRRRLALAGSLLAAAGGCEYLTAIPAVLLGVYLAAIRGPDEPARGAWARAGWLVAGALPVVLLVGVYHHVAFGAFWQTGYAHLANATFTAGHARGLMGVSWPSPSALFGILFSTERGLLYLAPVAAVALAGVLVRFRRLDLGAKVGLAAFLLLLLANAGYYMWWGGAATGPRHIVPVLPFLATGIACAWEIRLARAPILIVAALSVLNMTAFAAVGIEAPERQETLFAYAWARLLDGQVASLSSASNLGLLLGLRSTTSLAPLWVAWAFFARALWAAAEPQNHAPPLR
jgi:hypothetical protein